mmetsp:Transcript_30701/g.45777  ORF Transcript_30701/g.45777 Transcript_30701/m.45777 type:complete len:81 (-) Transcript_30701:1282-1524(-)
MLTPHAKNSYCKGKTFGVGGGGKQIMASSDTSYDIDRASLSSHHFPLTIIIMIIRPFSTTNSIKVHGIHLFKLSLTKCNM